MFGYLFYNFARYIFQFQVGAVAYFYCRSAFGNNIDIFQNDFRAFFQLSSFALAAWINGRKGWDPELGLHLCKVSKTINDIVFDCDLKLGGGLS